jgi:hypothetical protein
MNRPTTPLRRGTEILTHAELGETQGMFVDDDNLARRRVTARGTIAGVVAGHRGDVYWVDHGDDGAKHAAYCFDEFEIVDPSLPAARCQSAGGPAPQSGGPASWTSLIGFYPRERACGPTTRSRRRTLCLSRSCISQHGASASGTVSGVVGAHGGDVYWVMHAGAEVPAAYCFNEFDLEERSEDEGTSAGRTAA